MPKRPSAEVLLKMPDSSPVIELPGYASGRLSTEVSCTPLTPTLALKPGLSSGRAVLTLMVAPMPPVGEEARLLLKTSISDTDSDARLAKSNAREFEVPPPPGPRLEAGIWRPLSSTRLKSGPTPRTVTFEPSPLAVRSIDTPEMRCSDSARLVSGNLPMSSATMPSTMPCESRLRFIEDVRLPRIPVTVTRSSSVASSALVVV